MEIGERREELRQHAGRVRGTRRWLRDLSIECGRGPWRVGEPAPPGSGPHARTAHARREVAAGCEEAVRLILSLSSLAAVKLSAKTSNAAQAATPGSAPPYR